MQLEPAVKERFWSRVGEIQSQIMGMKYPERESASNNGMWGYGNFNTI